MKVTGFFWTVVCSVILFASIVTAEMANGVAEATFVVHCYDVGVSALEGRPGVISVTPGWSGFREIDRVTYDPGQTSVEKLERWLQQSGTYVSTLESSIPHKQ